MDDKKYSRVYAHNQLHLDEAFMKHKYPQELQEGKKSEIFNKTQVFDRNKIRSKDIQKNKKGHRDAKEPA